MIVYIFHRVNPALTQRAYDSVKDAGYSPTIVDNSFEFDFQSLGAVRLSPRTHTFASMHNWLVDTIDSYFWMHNDVVAPKETFDALYEAYKNRSVTTGAIFANYDTLCWFNSQAIKDAGWWDLALPQYFSDNDMYRRLRLKMWEIQELGLPLTHDHSNTIKDPAHLVVNMNTFHLYEELYNRKWGGLAGSETFDRPYNKLKL
jgi:hypothetical protein